MEHLVGDLVNLRALREKDYEYLAVLRNDLRTQGWNQREPPCFTPEKVKKRFESYLEDEHSGIFGIEAKDGRLLGYINYSERPPRIGATSGISLGIEFWGKGYAREASELLLKFLFEERGLHVVWIWTQSGNRAAINLAEKLGFKMSACIRESVILDSKRYDVILMDILREEYYKSRGLEDQIMDRGRE